MAKKKEEAIETIEATQEQLDGMVTENFSYGLAEMICMNDIENRIFYLDEEINENVFREVTMFVIKANIQDAGLPSHERLPIKLVINSLGGSVLDGVGLIDAIRASITPVHAIVVGYAYSMAFNVCCAADIRFATANSSFLCHDGSTGVFNSTTKVKDTMKFYDKLDERLDRMVASKTKLTMKELEDRKRQESFWFADEAKDLGIIDAIIGEDVDIEDVFCFHRSCNCEECSEES